MRPSRTMGSLLVLGAALLLPGAAVAGAPAGGWTPELVDTQAPDPCIAMYGAALCDRPGGLITKGQVALLLTADDGGVVAHRSTNGGDSWGAANQVGPDGARFPAIADDGIGVVYAYHGPGVGNRVHWGLQTSHGIPVAAGQRLKVPRQVITHLAVDIRQGMMVIAVAAFDEAIGDRPIRAIRVRTAVEGIDAPDHTTTFEMGGLPCGVRGMDPVVTALSTSKVVLAYWQNCEKLVVRRTSDFGETWTAPKVVSTRQHTMGMSIDAHGTTVVLAYTADGTTYTRRSLDGGSTWGSERTAGSGARSLRVRHADGAWHLLSGGTTSIRYRTSGNGQSWSAGETVDSLADARTFALGVDVTDQLLAAYAIRQSASEVDLSVARQ